MLTCDPRCCRDIRILTDCGKVATMDGLDDAAFYEPCGDCTCCTRLGCHAGPDSDCGWSDYLGDYTCPCTCE